MGMPAVWVDPMVGVGAEMVGADERKLIRLPRGSEELAFEVRHFEEERRCTLTEVRAREKEYLWVYRMMAGEQWLGVDVRLDREVREEHLVLVGCRNCERS